MFQYLILEKSVYWQCFFDFLVNFFSLFKNSLHIYTRTTIKRFYIILERVILNLRNRFQRSLFSQQNFLILPLLLYKRHNFFLTFAGHIIVVLRKGGRILHDIEIIFLANYVSRNVKQFCGQINFDFSDKIHGFFSEIPDIRKFVVENYNYFISQNVIEIDLVGLKVLVEREGFVITDVPDVYLLPDGKHKVSPEIYRLVDWNFLGFLCLL